MWFHLGGLRVRKKIYIKYICFCTQTLRDQINVLNSKPNMLVHIHQMIRLSLNTLEAELSQLQEISEENQQKEKLPKYPTCVVFAFPKDWYP